MGEAETLCVCWVGIQALMKACFRVGFFEEESLIEFLLIVSVQVRLQVSISIASLFQGSPADESVKLGRKQPAL